MDDDVQEAADNRADDRHDEQDEEEWDSVDFARQRENLIDSHREAFRIRIRVRGGDGRARLDVPPAHYAY
jgi:hypothetical protein